MNKSVYVFWFECVCDLCAYRSVAAVKMNVTPGAMHDVVTDRDRAIIATGWHYSVVIIPLLLFIRANGLQAWRDTSALRVWAFCYDLFLFNYDDNKRERWWATLWSLIFFFLFFFFISGGPFFDSTEKKARTHAVTLMESRFVERSHISVFVCFFVCFLN